MAERVSTKSPAQMFALVFGAVYALVGLLGFFVAKEVTGGSVDDKLILFPVNHLHNVVHLGIGAAWIVASRTHAMAKTVNLAIGAVYLLVALLGFTGINLMQTLLNIHTPGDADNFLHLVSGGLALYFGTAGAAQKTGTTTAV